jgi:hypothetical protein
MCVLFMEWNICVVYGMECMCSAWNGMYVLFMEWNVCVVHGMYV